jgi:hypothetical protein
MQQEAVEFLATGKPISIAGKFNGVMYIMHFEKS